MWLSTEDARSDFILAAAALVYGTMVAAFAFDLPFYPGGTFATLTIPVWVGVLMIVPARFLATNRGQGAEAFGLGPDRTGLSDGVLLALPMVVSGYVLSLASGGSVLGALLGRVRGVVGSPGVAQIGVLDLTYNAVLLVVAGVGATLLFGLLVVRARDAFREVDIPMLEALRTYGIGAVGVATVLGLLLAVADQRRLWQVLLESGTMVVTILVADRMVGVGQRTSRSTVLAPAIATAVAYVFSLGGLFSSNLALGLYRGALAAALTVVLATVIETRRSAWAAVPLLAATMWAPTCATLPIALLVRFNAPVC